MLLQPAGLLGGAMKKLIAAAAGLVFSAGSTFAQEASFDWTGAYVGAQAGYGWSGSDTWAMQNDTDLAYFPLEPDGLLTGIYLGYNQHLDNGIVLSAEADVTISNLSSGEAWLYYPDGTPYPLRNTATSRLEWSGALRARVGYAFGRFLPYAAAGVAAGKYEVIPDYFDTPPLPGDKTSVGWTAGVGVEYAVTDKLTSRIEYRYTDFGSKTYEITGFPTFYTRAELKTHDVRIGIGYRF